MKKLFIIMGLFLSFALVAYAATEDFTTWSETDESGTVTVTSSTVTVTNQEMNDLSYVRYDFGAGNVGDFTFTFKCQTSIAGSGRGMSYVVVGNSGDVSRDDLETNTSGIAFQYNRWWTNGRWQIHDYTNTNEAYYEDTYGADRWVEFTRSGTTCTAKIYSDSGMTTQLGSDLSITCGSDTYQYVYVMQSYDDDVFFGGNQVSGFIEDLEYTAGGGGGGGDPVFRISPLIIQ